MEPETLPSRSEGVNIHISGDQSGRDSVGRDQTHAGDISGQGIGVGGRGSYSDADYRMAWVERQMADLERSLTALALRVSALETVAVANATAIQLSRLESGVSFPDIQIGG